MELLFDPLSRLESVQQGSPKTVRRRGKIAIDMATLQRQPKSRSAATRQDRGSCSSTASCPVFSGPYSDQEEDPPLRRQSSLLSLKGLSPIYKAPPIKATKAPFLASTGLIIAKPPRIIAKSSRIIAKSSRISVKLSGLFIQPEGYDLRLKSRSQISLDNSNTSESCTSPSLQSATGSSSDDDGSWDTNSWSSGATCLLRTPVKKDSNEESCGKSSTTDHGSAVDEDEPEIIYQNLVYSRPVAQTESDGDSERTSTALRKDMGTQSVSSSSLRTTSSKVSYRKREEKTEHRRKFSQVLKSNGDPPQQEFNLRHRYSSPPPQPPTPTPSHNSLTTPQHSMPTNPPPPERSTSATNLWQSLTSSNLQTIKEYDMKDINSSIHQWSKTLPSCKILEPGDVLSKVKGESHSFSELNLELCTKIQAQPSTGRLYLETDIDSVRRLDELAANGTLGNERIVKTPEKVMEKGKERENRITWELNGGSRIERGKERGKRKENPWGRDRGIDKGKGKDKDGERPYWEKDRRMERGKEKEKNMVFPSYEPPLPQSTSSGRSIPCPVFSWPEGFPRMSYRTTSLPRPTNITESDGEMQHYTRRLLLVVRQAGEHSSLHDHKEDLRKRLSYTTHKLEMVETEFDSTRQYLETELRRAQEELEKFTEKLRRIQSSYTALQRINQDLEDKMHRTVDSVSKTACNHGKWSICMLEDLRDYQKVFKSQHHEEEKRALSREIILLNNHLMEAKITINKLREDNDLYRKDCNLAAQLLQCSKSHYRAHKMSELPVDLQERISSHMEKHNRGSGATNAMFSSNYSDAVPTSLIAKVLEKPEPGSSCPVTRSPSPQPQDGDFLTATGSTDHLNRRISYKTSDLYCSDTALYCPERWQNAERRQSVDLHGTALFQLHAQNSTDSNPDEEAYHSGTPIPLRPTGRLRHWQPPASSSYSSFSLASDEKGGVIGGGGRNTSSTLSSSHQGLYMDWRDGGSGDYERKSMSSYDKDSLSFPKSLSIQHMAIPRSPQKGSSPGYSRTASCFSEPYHSSTPRLASSHSMGSTTGLGQARDDVFNSRVLDQCFTVAPLSPSRSPKPMEHRKQEKTMLYRAKEDSQDSEGSLFLSGSSKEKESGGGAKAASSAKKDYVNLSADCTAESLHQSSLEASSLQHYPSPPSVRPRPSSSSALSVGPALPKKTSPRYQKFGSTGLTRKDSLTKAQLYDLDLSGPVAGGCSRRQNGMLGNAQAGLAVGAENPTPHIPHPEATVVPDLVSFESPPLVHSEGPLGGERRHVVPVSLGNKGLLEWVESQARARESLLEAKCMQGKNRRLPDLVDLVGEPGGGLVVPGDERAVGRVSAHTVRARYEVHTTSQKQDVQGLLDPGFVHFLHLETHINIKSHSKNIPYMI
ncbi:hypothetical protein F7725_008122 [Dissostichus mawsoni]|uniref:Brain-enriched guanylate kinase-associated protein n=1 Tax=Dissostichus mawsoni TaxID=36200 RepID=A0A7J5Y890_DISMA|nr:hypothetical protein F7725_008122 [Dissostichus mawsoni]